MAAWERSRSKYAATSAVDWCGSSTLLSCAILAATLLEPTGRSSPVIGASTGIEPLFRLTNLHLPGHLHPEVASILREHGRADLIEVVMADGWLPDDESIPGGLRALLATAIQISPAGHLAMAAAVRSCVDEAVAKTVNLPQTARPGDVCDIYLTAWERAAKALPSTRTARALRSPRHCSRTDDGYR